jgi:hypothetical protein
MLVEKKETRKARPATVIHKHVFICAPERRARAFYQDRKIKQAPALPCAYA